jgi:hypothetical protein
MAQVSDEIRQSLHDALRLGGIGHVSIHESTTVDLVDDIHPKHNFKKTRQVETLEYIQGIVGISYLYVRYPLLLDPIFSSPEL